MAGPCNRTDLARAFALGARFRRTAETDIHPTHQKECRSRAPTGGKTLAGVCSAKAPFGYPSFRITTLLLFHMQKTKVTTLMKIVNRPKRTTAELIALINQRQADWWPAEFRLTIERSAEHDWVAIVDSSADRRPDFASSLSIVVADLRLRNAWTGY